MNSFFKNILTYGIGEILTRGAQILILPLIFIYIDSTQFGMLDYFLSIKNILAIIMGMGLITSITRYSIEFKENDFSELVSNSILAIIPIGILIGTITFFFGSYFVKSGNSDSYSRAWLLIVLISLFNALITIPQAVLRTRKKATLYSLINVINFSFYALFSFLLLKYYAQNFYSFLYANLISAVIAFLFGIVLIREKIKFKVNKKLLYKLLKFGASILASSITFTLLINANRFFLKIDGDFSELGILGMAARISLVVGALLVLPFNLAWLPFINDLYLKDNFKDTIQKIFLLYSFVSVIFSISLPFFMVDFFNIIKHTEYLPSVYIVPFFSLSYMFLGFYFIFAGGIYLSEKSSQYLRVSIYTLIFNLVLYGGFFGHYSLYTVGIITLLSHFFLASLAYKYGNRILSIKLLDKNIIYIVIVVLFNSALSITLIYSHLSYIISFIIKTFGIVIFCGLGLYLLTKKTDFNLFKIA